MPQSPSRGRERSRTSVPATQSRAILSCSGSRPIFDQNDHGMAVIGMRLARDPRFGRNLCNTDMAGIEEIGRTLHGFCPLARIVRHGRFGRGRLAVAGGREIGHVFQCRPGEGLLAVRCGRPPVQCRAGGFLIPDGRIARQFFQRVAAPMKWPLFGRADVEELSNRHRSSSPARVVARCFSLDRYCWISSRDHSVPSANLILSM